MVTDQLALFEMADAADDATHGFRAPAVQAATGVTYRQLDYWARTGVAGPSVRAASGSGSQRLYSFADIVIVRVVKRLLDTGISLQNVRKAVDALRARGVDTAAALSEITLIGDGATIYELSDEGDIIDLLRGGQAVFGLAIKHTVAEVRGAVIQFPAEPGLTADPELPVRGDELAARRARHAS